MTSTAETIAKQPTAEMRAVREENIKEAQALLLLYRLYPLILQAIIGTIARFFFSFFGRLKVSGLEHLRNLSKGVILAPNHASELDPILMWVALPYFSAFKPLFYTSRGKGLYSRSGWRQRFYGGLLFKLLGAYPVILGVRNYEKSLSTHIKLLKKGETIVIFPEGTRTIDGNIQGGKGGVMYLAEKANAPIVPVVIDGTFHLGFLDFFLRRRKIKITFGKPIYTKDIFPTGYVKVEEYRLAAQSLMNIIRRL